MGPWVPTLPAPSPLFSSLAPLPLHAPGEVASLYDRLFPLGLTYLLGEKKIAYVLEKPHGVS